MKQIIFILTSILIYILIQSLVVMNSLAIPSTTLPKTLHWENNDHDTEWSDSKAQKGGVFRTFVNRFPLTFRYVGPEANHSLRFLVESNLFPLVLIHPNSRKPIPALATSWSLGSDHKTVYYKINPLAKWSDGTPITADDFIYTLEFMTSPYILDPVVEHEYKNYFEKVIKFDDHTIAIVGKHPCPPHLILTKYSLFPTPRHFFKKLDQHFIRDFNWKPPVVSGPYVISAFSPGEWIKLSRVKNWWGENLRYYRYRFNVDEILFKVVPDLNVAYHYFKRGELDHYPLTIPESWQRYKNDNKDNKKNITVVYKKTYAPTSIVGFWPNLSHPLLKDIKIRKAIFYSLNISKVVATVLQNDYEIASLFGEGHGYYSNNKIKNVAFHYDLKITDKMFAETPFSKRGSDGIRVNSKGERLSLMITTGMIQHKDRLVILQQEALKAGVELKLQFLEPGLAFKTIMERKFELCYFAWAPMEFLRYREYFHSEFAQKIPSNNISGVSDHELDHLIDRYEMTMKETEAQLLSKEIQKMIHDKVYYFPTWKASFFREAYFSVWHFPQKNIHHQSRDLFDFTPLGGQFWFWK